MPQKNACKMLNGIRINSQTSSGRWLMVPIGIAFVFLTICLSWSETVTFVYFFGACEWTFARLERTCCNNDAIPHCNFARLLRVDGGVAEKCTEWFETRLQISNIQRRAGTICTENMWKPRGADVYQSNDVSCILDPLLEDIKSKPPKKMKTNMAILQDMPGADGARERPHFDSGSPTRHKRMRANQRTQPYLSMTLLNRGDFFLHVVGKCFAHDNLAI